MRNYANSAPAPFSLFTLTVQLLLISRYNFPLLPNVNLLNGAIHCQLIIVPFQRVKKHLPASISLTCGKGLGSKCLRHRFRSFRKSIINQYLCSISPASPSSFEVGLPRLPLHLITLQT